MEMLSFIKNVLFCDVNFHKILSRKYVEVLSSFKIFSSTSTLVIFCYF